MTAAWWYFTRAVSPRASFSWEERDRGAQTGNGPMGIDVPDYKPGGVNYMNANEKALREFETGATRSSDLGRIDPEAALSPLVIERYNEYILKHRRQADGALRDMDNWQKGIPLAVYFKGLWRHMLHAWQRHRGWTVVDPKAAVDIQEDLCAIIFNAQG
jgi:hypothetical protein